MRRHHGREEDIIFGPEAEGLKVPKTRRIIVLNICDQNAEWGELKDFIKSLTGFVPTYVNIFWGFDKNWAVVEMDTLEEARRVVEILNGFMWKGEKIYLRQDRDDRCLEVTCANCTRPRNNGLTGEWWGADWSCIRCTIAPELHHLPITDTHVHLEFVMEGREFDISDQELTEAIKNLALSGPMVLITSCCDVMSVETTKKLVSCGDGHVYCTFGAHPRRGVWEWGPEMKEIYMEAIEKYRKYVVAWGECGLDFAGLTPIEDHTSEIERQKRVLIENIEVAVNMSLPIQFHSRDCEQTFIDILLEHLPRNHKFQWHSAIASPAAAQKILNLFPHCYFGISGYIAFPYARDWELKNQSGDEDATTVDLFEMVRGIPLNRIVLETDAPHFTVSSGGPADCLEVASAIADIKDVTVEEVVYTCAANAYNLYGIVAKPVTIPLNDTVSMKDLQAWKAKKQANIKRKTDWLNLKTATKRPPEKQRGPRPTPRVLDLQGAVASAQTLSSILG